MISYHTNSTVAQNSNSAFPLYIRMAGCDSLDAFAVHTQDTA